MLQDIRDNAQGTIAKVIIGLLIVSLSIWGMDAIIGGFSGEPEVATVNGEDITERQFTRVVRMETQRRLSEMERPDPSLLNEDQIRSEVMETLIQEAVMNQDAKNQGLELSDADVDALITQMPQFQVDGSFNRDRFVNLVRNAGMGVAEFREAMRKQYVANQIRNGIGQTALVSDTNVDYLLGLQNQTRDFRALTLPAESVEDQVEVTEADIEAFYEENQSDFQQPEQVTARYLVLSLGSLAEQVEVNDEELEAYYEERADELANEQRRAAHILIEEDGEASETMATIQERLEAGESFAALAEEYSIDTVSAEEGGDLGFAGRAVYDEAFESALFELEEGQVSEPVSTSFGLHLIKLLDVRRSEPPTLAEMEEELRSELARRKAEEAFAEARSELSDIAYSSDNLQDPARDLDLEVRETSGVTREGGNPPFDHAGLVRQLFSEDVLEGGYNTEVIDVEDNMAVVARVGEYQEARVQPLAEVQDQIRTRLVAEQTREALEQRAEAIIAELSEGKSLSAIEGVEGNWSSFRNQTRNNQSLGRAVTQRVFSMPRPDGDKPSYDQIPRGNDMVVLALESVNEDDTESSDQERQQIARLLTSMAGQREYQAYQEYLRNQAEIERP